MKQRLLGVMAALFVSFVCVAQAQAQSDGSACRGTHYIGTLQFTGDFEYEPNGSYYYSSAFGLHKGCLVEPSDADFDLYLQKWTGSAWVIVASSDSVSSIETISSFGGPGYYAGRFTPTTV